MTAGYGDGPDIISSCSITANRGEIVAILGPNGAGKSTAMKAMLGLLKLKSGSILIDGKDISETSPQDRVKQGISFDPQTKNVFADLTVRENLEIGAFLRNDDVNKVIDEIYELFPVLKEKNYTFCMIEHDMDFISRMCDPVIVMSEGSVLFQGTPNEVKKNEKVIESYLGRANKINGENS